LVKYSDQLDGLDDPDEPDHRAVRQDRRLGEPMANPMYRQIAEDLREQIESGVLRPGQQLRTELELRDHYGASRNTVRDAIKWLITLGLVETKPGQGTFVVQKIDPFVTTLTADPKRPGGDKVAAPGEGGYGEIDRSQAEGQPRKLTVTEPQVEIQKAVDTTARELQVAVGSQVVSRHQKRYIDGTPWSLQTSFYPMGFVLKGADRLIEASDITGGTVQYLADSLGLRQVSYRGWILVRAPDPTEALFFSLAQDGRVGVFEILETGYDQTGTPMRLTVTIFPTDRNQFVVNVGPVPEEQPADDMA
jgi:GntR family transcriptional regulator